MAATGKGEGEKSDPGGLGTASDSDPGGWVWESVRRQVEALEEAPTCGCLCVLLPHIIRAP